MSSVPAFHANTVIHKCLSFILPSSGTIAISTLHNTRKERNNKQGNHAKFNSCIKELTREDEYCEPAFWELHIETF